MFATVERISHINFGFYGRSPWQGALRGGPGTVISKLPCLCDLQDLGFQGNVLES